MFLNVITFFLGGFYQFQHPRTDIILQSLRFPLEDILQLIQFIGRNPPQLPQLPLQRIRRIGDPLTGFLPFGRGDQDPEGYTGDKPR